MGVFGWLGELFSGGAGASDMHSSATNSEINPATGLPMVDGTTGGVDVAGNQYGTSDDSFGGAMDHDSFGSGMGNDSFGGGGFDNW